MQYTAPTKRILATLARTPIARDAIGPVTHRLPGLQRSDPALNAVAALLWWDERLDRPTALGLALALAATVLLNRG